MLYYLYMKHETNFGRRNRSGRKRWWRRRRKHVHVPVSEDFDTSTEITGPVVFVPLAMSAFHIRASYWRGFAFDTQTGYLLYLWIYYSFLSLVAANHVKCLLHSLELICHCHITTRRCITQKKNLSGMLIWTSVTKMWRLIWLRMEEIFFRYRRCL